MTESPYSPPGAEVADAEEDVGLPAEIEKKIKNCWLAGVVSTVLTLIFTLLAVFGTSIAGVNALAFIDAIILAALSFGVYKQSRVCAVCLLAFFLLNKIIMWMSSPTVTSVPMTLVFLWFYWQGVAGTFQAHRFRRESRAMA